jgi:hypothetical protein
MNRNDLRENCPILIQGVFYHLDLIFKHPRTATSKLDINCQEGHGKLRVL